MEVEKRIEDLISNIEKVGKTLNSDVFFYNGDIGLVGQYRMTREVIHRRHPNALLILVTDGGNPHAGYAISRLFQQKFQEFRVMTIGRCKSAGTTVALGALEIVMGDHGELGPLDMQLKKIDEADEFASALNVKTALGELTACALETSEKFANGFRKKYKLRTKSALELANSLTSGLYRGIFEQIDPLQVGEVTRSNKVAEEYGAKLGVRYGNLREGALQRLVSGYPSHGFVIDLEEAQSLFYRVRGVDQDEFNLYISLLINGYSYYPNDEDVQVINLTGLAAEYRKQQKEEADAKAATEAKEANEDHSATKVLAIKKDDDELAA